MKILVTGAAGFIGFHLAKRLLDEGHEVLGIDNFNDYYSVELKCLRHAQLERYANYQWRKMDITDECLRDVFSEFTPNVAVNLAAQPGVRYSLTHPEAYLHSNLAGFLNVLECCRHAKIKPKLLFASSSSVYGGNKDVPFTEDQKVDNPVSLYAATKKSNELMAYCYSHLFDVQTLGFRFFTVYGPWGRPDMAYFSFAESLMAGKSIKVFNNGDMYRDFTFIDDIVEGIVRCIYSDSLPRYEIYNIGNHRCEKLTDMIKILADALGVKNPAMEFLPMQPGDVYQTYASIDKLKTAVGYEPTTPISVGLPKFVEWYKEWKSK